MAKLLMNMFAGDHVGSTFPKCNYSSGMGSEHGDHSWVEWEYANPVDMRSPRSPSLPEQISACKKRSPLNQHPRRHTTASDGEVMRDATGRPFTCDSPSHLFNNIIPPPAALELRRNSWLDWESEDDDKENMEPGKLDESIIPPSAALKSIIAPPSALLLRRNSWREWECGDDGEIIPPQAALLLIRRNSWIPPEIPEWVARAKTAVEVGFEMDTKMGTCTVCFDGRCLIVPASDLRLFTGVKISNPNWRRDQQIGL